MFISRQSKTGIFVAAVRPLFSGAWLPLNTSYIYILLFVFPTLYYRHRANIIDMMRLHCLNCTPLYCWLRKILIKSDAIHWDFPKGYWYAIKELYFVRGMD